MVCMGFSFQKLNVSAARSPLSGVGAMLKLRCCGGTSTHFSVFIINTHESGEKNHYARGNGYSICIQQRTEIRGTKKKSNSKPKSN